MNAEHSAEPFGVALAGLMQLRGFSWRKLGYLTGKTGGYLHHTATGIRPVPGDELLEAIARRLGVAPDYFLEYRQRRVEEALRRDPAALDDLYSKLTEGTEEASTAA
jgi:transcriptional regulator with XRE-family HTH domain